MNNDSYERAQWPSLSPTFRAVHNRKRAAYGLTPIPEPDVDLYVPPAASSIRTPDDADKQDAWAATSQFTRPTMMVPGNEGFSINGKPADFRR